MWISGEVGTLVDSILDVHPGALCQEVELADDPTAVNGVIEGWLILIAIENQVWCHRRLLVLDSIRDMDIADDLVDEVRLHQLHSSIIQLLDVDTKVVGDVTLILGVIPKLT